MGIQHLNSYIKKTVSKDAIIKKNLQELNNKVIAVDISIYLYRFLAENSLLENMYLMISLFRYYNIIPIFVFDGKPPSEKFNIIEKRQKDKNLAEIKHNELQASLINIKDSNTRVEIEETLNNLKKKFIRLKKNDVRCVKELLDAFGAYYIEAIGEADELCARLVIKKYAYACLSEDMDLFLYGCPRVLRYLSLTNESVIIYNLNLILKDLNLTFKEFKEICVVAGTDYNTNTNITLLKTLDYFKKYKMLELDIDFYTWLDNENYIDNIFNLYNAYNMFEPTKTKLPRLNNLTKNIQLPKIKKIMEPEGFIFLD